jgi:hypothetical protein
LSQIWNAAPKSGLICRASPTPSGDIAVAITPQGQRNTAKKNAKFDVGALLLLIADR